MKTSLMNCLQMTYTLLNYTWSWTYYALRYFLLEFDQSHILIFEKWQQGGSSQSTAKNINVFRLSSYLSSSSFLRLSSFMSLSSFLRSSSFLSLRHFWGCLYFWGRLNFFRSFSFLRSYSFFGRLYFWNPTFCSRASPKLPLCCLQAAHL